MRLDKATSLFLGATINPRTRSTYAYALTRMVDFVGSGRELEQVSPELLLEYSNLIHSQELSPSTKQKHIKTIKMFFNWLVKNEFIAKSPARIVKTPSIPLAVEKDKAIHDHELEIILDFVKWKPRDYALFLFLADTGCRAGGAAGLTVDDLDLEQKVAYVTEKGEKRRPVWFEDKCRTALRRWLIRQSPTKGRFVFTHDGARMGAKNVSKIVRRACIATGIRSLGAHSFRHRKGHQFAEDKVAPSIAAVALGHSSIGTTLNHYYPQDYKSAELAIRRLATKETQSDEEKREEDKIIVLADYRKKNG